MYLECPRALWQDAGRHEARQSRARQSGAERTVSDVGGGRRTLFVARITHRADRAVGSDRPVGSYSAYLLHILNQRNVFFHSNRQPSASARPHNSLKVSSAKLRPSMDLIDIAPGALKNSRYGHLRHAHKRRLISLSTRWFILPPQPN